MNTKTFRSQQSKARDRRRFRPAIVGLEDRMMLASGSTADVKALPIHIKPYPENQGLSVKRVPGFLAGWKANPDLAAPFDNANVLDRAINDSSVDYWAITLNKDDSVVLAINNLDGSPAPASAFAFRVWGPGPGYNSLGGYQQSPFPFDAVKEQGTYIIGISTPNNTSYTFAPNLAKEQPTSSSEGPGFEQYNVAFNTIPGPKTDLLTILKDQSYKNPTYSALDGTWPTLSASKKKALETITHIATEGTKIDPSLFLGFGGSFLKVSSTEPAIIDMWLKNAWDPFQNLLNNASPDASPQVIAEVAKRTFSASPEIRAAYPNETKWMDIARGIIKDPRPYTDVHSLLQSADLYRTAIKGFVANFDSWTKGNADELLGNAVAIANQLQNGLRGKLSEPVEEDLVGRGFWDLNSRLAVTVSVSTGQFIGNVLSGGNPLGTIVGGLIGGLVGSALSTTLTSALIPYLYPPKKTDYKVTDAGTQIDQYMKENFSKVYQTLLDPKFMKDIFSNYALLSAMGRIEFAYTPKSGDTQSKSGSTKSVAKASEQSSSSSTSPTLGIDPQGLYTITRKAYNTAVWRELLPRTYKWELVPVGDKARTSLPNFSFFIPSSETAEWGNPTDAPPLKGRGSSYRWDWASNKKKPWNFPDPMPAAEAEIEALQSGGKFNFPGYDKTNKTWFGPGPISVSQTIEGDSARFYTITNGATLDQTVYRDKPYRRASQYGSVGGYYLVDNWWRTDASVKGATIQQWALVPREGKGELSESPAKTLFGTGSLALAAPKPISKTGGSYLDFKVPADGLVSRSEVFFKWGEGVPGFSPDSLQPKGGKFEGMTVGVNRNNDFTAPNPNGGLDDLKNNDKFIGSYADFKIKYQ